MHAAMMEHAWNAKRGAFTAAFGGDDLDASVLLLHELGAIEAERPAFRLDGCGDRARTYCAAIMSCATQARTISALPEGEFLICRFWLIDAWWALGRKQEARDLFADAMQYRNRYGLLAEHIHMQTGAMWGNFPQTYSMAGLILTAMRLSRSWEDRYWRG